MSLGIALLGSTGSIGKSALEVVRHHPDRLKVVALAAYGNDPEGLAAQAREFHPRLVAVVNLEAAAKVATLLPAGVRLASGPEGLLEAATHPDASRVLAAMVGAAGNDVRSELSDCPMAAPNVITPLGLTKS